VDPEVCKALAQELKEYQGEKFVYSIFNKMFKGPIA
jgi:hypothetical protein